MWIMLTKKPPVQNSPPKMSILWSTPWPMEGFARKHAKKMQAMDGNKILSPHWREEFDGQEKLLDEWRFVPNYLEARRIKYHGQDIRVFPHEFSVLELKNMRLYVFGHDDGSPSHYLQPDSVAEDALVSGALDGITKPIYEAALLDGANYAQAMITALGVDITYPEAEFPPIGWYLCRPEYAAHFCEPWEMEG